MLKAIAQELIVVDPHELPKEHQMQLIPLEVSLPGHEEDLEISTPCEELPEHEREPELVIELADISDIPGAPHGTRDPEEPLEIVDSSEDEKKKDDNDAASSKKDKKPSKWDWESRGASGFIAWLKEMLAATPSHSGYDVAGLERAVAYLEKLDNEISKAMRNDLDGELDANEIEKVRAKIDEWIGKCNERTAKLRKHTKSRRKKSAEETHGLVKEGQKITGVQGIYVVVPLFISSLGRICINSMVSGGHDIGRVYNELAKKWKLTEREKAELLQFLDDCGYQMRRDRAFMPDEDIDTASSDNFDWMANYRG